MEFKSRIKIFTKLLLLEPFITLAVPCVFNIEFGTICQLIPPLLVYMKMPLSPTATDIKLL